MNGELHRENGPAVIMANGTRVWCRNGERHREDGPAIVRADGTQIWYRDGQLHREDGPAIVWADGSEEYWERGVKTIKRDYAPSPPREDKPCCDFVVASP